MGPHAQPPGSPEPPEIDLGFSDHDRSVIHEAFGSFGLGLFGAGMILLALAALAARLGLHVVLTGALIVAATCAVVCGCLLILQRRRILDDRRPPDADVFELLAKDFHRRRRYEAEAAARRGRDAALRLRAPTSAEDEGGSP